MKFLTLSAIAVTLGLAACAMSSDAQQIGPDTYTLSAIAAPARGGIFGARQVAFKGAAAFCQQSGKEILVRNIQSQPVNNFGAGSVDLIFRCLQHGDPELASRPEYDKEPDMVIENRSN
jgi:hypothetical protein